MNNHILIDAISYLDTDLLSNHLERKEKNEANKKRIFIMRWTTIAACFCLVVAVGVYTIPNLIGYQSGLSEDEIFERSNTYFDSYEELVAIIGNDTLLDNIDFSTLADYELRINHALDNVNDFSYVSFVDIMPEDSFGIGIYFPPYKDKIAYFADDESTIANTITINGITVKYENRTKGSKLKYNYIAEFEYDGCFYQIRSSGHTDESVFWSKLNELFGN